MNFSKRFAIALLVFPALAALGGGNEGMPQMPQIAPKKSYTVKSKDEGEGLLEKRGFGDQESHVRMMNLMMVEGSGMEGMEMDMSPKGTEQPHSVSH